MIASPWLLFIHILLHITWCCNSNIYWDNILHYIANYGFYCILIYLIVAYDWWSFVGILLRIVWYGDLTIIWRWTCLQEFLVILAQCVLLHFVCIDLVEMSGCHEDVAIFTGLGVQLCFFYMLMHALHGVMAISEPPWLVSLLVHFVGFFFHWSTVCACRIAMRRLFVAKPQAPVAYPHKTMNWSR